MEVERCPQIGCGEYTQELFVEEGPPNGEVRLSPVVGVRWCPRDGVIESATQAGRSGPARIGPFLKAEIDREFARRGERVWRTARPGETTEMMDGARPASHFWLRVAFVRWDPNTHEIRPLKDLGSDYTVLVESVNRSRSTLVPPDIEADLR